MTRTLTLCAALLAPLGPLAAQQNPFRPTAGIQSAIVQYALSGDQSGTEELAFTPERRATRTTATTRVFGKDVKSSRLEVHTYDSVYSVDLAKKEGYRSAFPRAAMADEYDRLSAGEKQRFEANARELAGSLARAFGGAAPTAGESNGRETIAGQPCDLQRLGTWTVCTLAGAPTVPLKVQGEFMCLRINQVATTVSVNAPVPADRFALPGDVKWKSAEGQVMSERDARAFVRQLASQELADSLARAKQQLQAARDSAKVASDSLTPEQRDQACRVMRDGIQLHLEVSPPNPGKLVQSEIAGRVASADSLAKAAVSGAVEAAKARAKEGIRGRLKPRIP